VWQPFRFIGVNMANNPRAGTDALANWPGVKLTEELVETRRAVNADKANLAVLSVERGMNGTLLESKS
jgi:flagellar basal body rod protein FlgC